MKDRRRAAALGLLAGLGLLAVLTNAAPLRPPPQYAPRITVDLLAHEHAHPVVLFLGDGLATASPGVPATRTFPWRACAVLGAVCNVSAQAGSGYTTGGDDPDATTATYGQRLAGITGLYLADVVVVTGGGDDAGRPGTYQAARRLFGQLALAYPQAQLVAVEPFAAGDDPSAAVVRLRAAVRKAASEAGFRWVGTAGWLTAGRLTGDREHLNQAGHEAVGAKLARALQPVVTGGTTTGP